MKLGHSGSQFHLREIQVNTYWLQTHTPWVASLSRAQQHLDWGWVPGGRTQQHEGAVDLTLDRLLYMKYAYSPANARGNRFYCERGLLV